MQFIENALEFLKSAALLSLGQLISVFGIFFVFGLILFLIARMTRRVYVKSGWVKLDVFLTGWIGTPVHEMGHAFFCLVFRHKIVRIKLFDPNTRDGSIGYVIHSYNPKNVWHQAGNFFIGVGPLIFGSVTIFLLMHLLLPAFRDFFSETLGQGMSIKSIHSGNWMGAIDTLLPSIRFILSELFSSVNVLHWQFWLFVYLSMSIASHMELSPSDLKSALRGFIVLIIIFFVFNMVVLAMNTIGINLFAEDVLTYFELQTIRKYLSGFTALVFAVFLYAIVISLLNFLLSWILLSLYTIIRKRTIINPFWG